MSEPESQPRDEAGELIPTPAEVAVDPAPEPEPVVAEETPAEESPVEEDFVGTHRTPVTHLESQVQVPYQVPADFKGHTAFSEENVRHIL